MFYMMLFASMTMALAVIDVSSEPLASPSFQQVVSPGTAVVTCAFSKPLIACRVRMSDHRHHSFDKVVNMSRDNATVTVNVWDNNKVTAMTFAGHTPNDCGVSISMDSRKGILILVEIFGQAEGGDWTCGWALVKSDIQPVLSTTSSTPPLIVTTPGTDVSVLLKAQGPLNKCIIKTPAYSKLHLLPNKPLSRGSRYHPHVAGAVHGECGATLRRVTADDAGMWWWHGKQGESDGWRATVVLLTSAPVGKPVLSVLNSTLQLRVGDVMEASCRAPPSVPPPMLTWLLDGKVVRQDDGNATLPGDVAKSLPWEPQGAVQTYTWKLSSQDFGKQLVCRADHPTGVDSDGLILTRPPKPPAAGCPALATDSTRAVCTLAGNRVDCSSAPVPLQTSAKLACREGYKPPDNHPNQMTTKCNRKVWRPRPLVCYLDCGHRKDNVRALSVGGQETLETEFPWHVGVFKWDSHSRTYKLSCGGSLVSPKFFVSAAHCFWDLNAQQKLNETLYKAAVGKHTLAWETEDEHEQRMDISVIHLPRGFNSNIKRFEADIAVVELSTSIRVTRAVNVVCVDWHTSNLLEDRLLVNHPMGVVTGFGYTENNTASPTLRFVDLPYVPMQDCEGSVPREYQGYLLADKICGGYTNRSTGVCPGDSGGGFVFPTRKDVGDRYYLRGVVSNSPDPWGPKTRLCQADHRSTFTRISSYNEWIQDIVFAFDEGDY